SALYVLQGDHIGAVRWNGAPNISLMGAVANASFTAIIESDAGEVVETGGGSLTSNGYSVSATYGSVQIASGVVQPDGLAPSSSAFFSAISTVVPFCWSLNSACNANPGITYTGAAGGTTIIRGSVLLNVPGGFLTRFRNGTFDVWQRGTSSLAT